MNKWSEIKQATLHKLFLSEAEARQQEYLEKFEYLANECLDFIANGVKPKIKYYTVLSTDKYLALPKNIAYDSDNHKITFTDDNGNSVSLEPSDVIYYDKEADKKYRLIDNKLIETKDAMLNEPVEMPDDFLSFAEARNYLDDKPDPELIYINDRSIQLPEVGTYRIAYNSAYEPITQDKIQQDSVLNIPPSILNCLPTYIAAQILSQDDIQRSTILMNQFELMISRLDTTVYYEEKQFTSPGGWF